MYNEYFGFTEPPFNVTSDPRFFYSNRHYQEAFTGLRWGIKLHQGLIVMTGEPGTGKTTLLRMVTEKFEPGTRSALILGPYRDFSALLQLMLIDFGIPKPPGGQFTIDARAKEVPNGATEKESHCQSTVRRGSRNGQSDASGAGASVRPGG